MEFGRLPRPIRYGFPARSWWGPLARPASAIELGRRFGIPIAACYRRIKELEGLGLVYRERAEPSRNGRGLQLYPARLRSLHIPIEDRKLRTRLVLAPKGLAAPYAHDDTA